MVEVRSYTKRDGTQVSAHTRSAPGGGVVAVVAAVALAIGLSSGTVTISPAPRRPAVTKKVEARTKVTVQAMVRLQRKGYRVTARTSADGSDCAGHSYGEVRGFFRERPCSALGRMLFEVRDRRRNVVLVAVAVVGMPDARSAERYRQLVDRHGTGNVTELSRESGRYRRVRFAGAPYVSARDGEVVVNVQAQPVGRSPGKAVLDELVRTARG